MLPSTPKKISPTPASSSARFRTLFILSPAFSLLREFQYMTQGPPRRVARSKCDDFVHGSTPWTDSITYRPARDGTEAGRPVRVPGALDIPAPRRARFRRPNTSKDTSRPVVRDLSARLKSSFFGSHSSPPMLSAGVVFLACTSRLWRKSVPKPPVEPASFDCDDGDSIAGSGPMRKPGNFLDGRFCTV